MKQIHIPITKFSHEQVGSKILTVCGLTFATYKYAKLDSPGGFRHWLTVDEGYEANCDACIIANMKELCT